MIEDGLAGHVLKAMDTAKSEVVEVIAAITMEEIIAVAKRADEIMRASPFQLNPHIPDDADMILKIDGKFVMGKTKWRQFNLFMWPRYDEQGAARWIAEQKIYDLDEIAKNQTAWLFEAPVDYLAGHPKRKGPVGASGTAAQGEDHPGAKSE